MTEAGERLEVGELADPPRVDELAVDGVGHPGDLLEVEAAEHPVPVDVGVGEVGDPPVLEAGDRLRGAQGGRLGPARGRDPAAPDVDRDDSRSPWPATA